jgi:GTP pyrophosphokinase
MNDEFKLALLRAAVGLGQMSTVLPHTEELQRAYEFAWLKHFGQVRPGGELQFEHAFDVAVRTLNSFPQSIFITEEQETAMTAAMLHDVIEDTDTTHREVSERFGCQVADIVQAVSHEEEGEPDAVYLRRVAAGGKLAVIVKRSDRLDNLNKLRTAPRELRERKLAEVRAALPLWYEIDPTGASQIEELLEEVEHESATP